MSMFTKAGAAAAILLTTVLGATQDVCSWSFEGSGDWDRVTDGCIDANNQVVPCPDAGSSGATVAALDAGAAIDPDEPVEVVVSPASGKVGAGGKFQPTVRVLNASFTAVVWSLRNDSLGSINVATGLYTAPNYAASPGAGEINEQTTATLRATSLEDPTKYDELVLTVLPYRIDIVPGAARLNPGDSLDFNARHTGSVVAEEQEAYVWHVLGSGGTIDTQTGAFVAGVSPGTVTVRATSVADPSYAVTAVVTVTNGPLVEVVTHAEKLTLVAGVVGPPAIPADTVALSADVRNAANVGVTWSLELVGSNGLGGAQIVDGVLVAGTSTSAGFKVRATSVEDPSKSDTIDVVVVAATTRWRLTGSVTRAEGLEDLPGTLFVVATGRLVGATVADASGDYVLTVGVNMDAPDDDVEVQAWLDVDGTGTFMKGACPSGVETFTVVDDEDPEQTVVDTITLEAAPTSDEADQVEPVLRSVVAAGNAALVLVGVDPEDDSDDVWAKAIRVEVFEGATATGTPVKTLTAPSGLDTPILVTGLSSNTQYTFNAVATYNTSVEVDAVETVTLPRIDPPDNVAGETTVRVQVGVSHTLGALAGTGTGALTTIVVGDAPADGAPPLFARRQSFTASAGTLSVDVPGTDGGYLSAIAFIDTNGDGLLYPGEPRTGYSLDPSEFLPASQNSSLSLTDGRLVLPPLVTPATDIVGRFSRETLDGVDGGRLQLRSNRRMMVRASLARGPAVEGLDYPRMLSIGRSAAVDLSIDFSSGAWPTGTYGFDILFADGTTRNVDLQLAAAPASATIAGSTEAEFHSAGSSGATGGLEITAATDATAKYELEVTASGALTDVGSGRVKWAKDGGEQSGDVHDDNGTSPVVLGGGTFSYAGNVTSGNTWVFYKTYPRVATNLPMSYTLSAPADGTSVCIRVRDVGGYGAEGSSDGSSERSYCRRPSTFAGAFSMPSGDLLSNLRNYQVTVEHLSHAGRSRTTRWVTGGTGWE